MEKEDLTQRYENTEKSDIGLNKKTEVNMKTRTFLIMIFTFYNCFSGDFNNLKSFDFKKVNKIIFYREETNKINNIKVVSDIKIIKEIIDSIKLESKIPCGCVHNNYAVFCANNNVKHIDFCEHCFSIYKMPKKFFNSYKKLKFSNTINLNDLDQSCDLELINNKNKTLKIFDKYAKCNPDVLIAEIFCDINFSTIIVHPLHNSFFYNNSKNGICTFLGINCENIRFHKQKLNIKENELVKFNILFVKKGNFYHLKFF